MKLKLTNNETLGLLIDGVALRYKAEVGSMSKTIIIQYEYR